MFSADDNKQNNVVMNSIIDRKNFNKAVPFPNNKSTVPVRTFNIKLKLHFTTALTETPTCPKTLIFV